MRFKTILFDKDNISDMDDVEPNSHETLYYSSKVFDDKYVDTWHRRNSSFQRINFADNFIALYHESSNEVLLFVSETHPLFNYDILFFMYIYADTPVGRRPYFSEFAFTSDEQHAAIAQIFKNKKKAILNSVVGEVVDYINK